MTVFWILALFCLLVLLVLLCPIEVHVRYDGKFTLRAGAAGIRFRILPSWETLLNDPTLSLEKKRRIRKKILKKEARAERKAAKKALAEAKKTKGRKESDRKKKPKEKDEKKAPKRKKSLFRDIRFLARAVKILLAKFGRRLKVRLRTLSLTAASGDAAKTALLYGGMAQAAAYLLAALDSFSRLTCRRGAVSVSADFLSETPKAEIDVLFSIRVGSLLSLGFSAVWLFVKEGFAKAGKRDASDGAGMDSGERGKKKEAAKPSL